jgi:hypothetical protein
MNSLMTNAPVCCSARHPRTFSSMRQMLAVKSSIRCQKTVALHQDFIKIRGRSLSVGRASMCSMVAITASLLCQRKWACRCAVTMPSRVDSAMKRYSGDDTLLLDGSPDCVEQDDGDALDLHVRIALGGLTPHRSSGESGWGRVELAVARVVRKPGHRWHRASGVFMLSGPCRPCVDRVPNWKRVI